MKKNIFFVGRPYPYPSVIEALRRQGYGIGIFLDNTITIKNAALFDQVIKTDFSNPRSLIKSVSDAAGMVDGLLCTYENYIVAKSLLADHFKVASLDYESALKCTDKYLMRQAFLKTDRTITPKFGLVNQLEDALEIAGDLGYPLILKPTNLVKSLLVLRCNDKASLRKNFEYAQKNIKKLYKKQKVYGREPQLILEEYVSGQTCSIAAFVDAAGNASICEGVVSLTNAQDIGVNDNYLYSRQLPGDFSPRLKKRMVEVAEKGIKALGLTSSPAHVELVYTGEEVKIIEIGARIGGYRDRMYKLSYGINLIEQEVRLALGLTPTLDETFKAYTAVYEIFPANEGRFKGIEGLLDASVFTRFTLRAKPGDMVGPAKQGYKAAAVVTVSSPSHDEFSRMKENAKSLTVRTN